jgi:hypothetical protein
VRAVLRAVRRVVAIVFLPFGINVAALPQFTFADFSFGQGKSIRLCSAQPRTSFRLAGLPALSCPLSGMKRTPSIADTMCFLIPTGCPLGSGASPQVAEKLLGLSDKSPEVGASRACLSREAAMFQRVRIASGRARTLGPAMHAAPLFATHGRRSAWRTRTGPCSAAGAGEHRTRVSPVQR